MARLVLQSEIVKEGGRSIKVFHLAVMRDGCIGEHSYVEWRNHKSNAHYLCCGEPKNEYQSWDNLDLGPLHRILFSTGYTEERLCERCLGVAKGAK